MSRGFIGDMQERSETTSGLHAALPSLDNMNMRSQNSNNSNNNNNNNNSEFFKVNDKII